MQMLYRIFPVCYVIIKVKGDLAMQADMIESLLNKGRIFEAHNELQSSLRENPGDIRLCQLLGLTLARLGLIEKARVLMEDLASRQSDSETSGILGRIYKDYWKLTGDPDYLDLSVATYKKAFLEKNDGYNGINAATLTFLSGNRADAVQLAEKTIQYVEQWPDGYWKEASLGEAYLLTGDNNTARQHYKKANTLGKSDPGSVHSTVEQLKILAKDLPAAGEMLNLFDKPVIVIFAGHMIDNPVKKTVRFPESAAGDVKSEISGFLDRINAAIGYSSLACGGDILFAESILEKGMELNIVLPFKIDDFIKTSVGFAAPAWIDRFNNILARAHSIKFTTEEGYLGDDILFDLCSRQFMGLGILRSEFFSVKPWFLTVWDEAPGKTGGTADSVKYFPWPEQHFNILPLKNAKTTVESSPATRQVPEVNPVHHREMKYILFSDISGFSRLDEEKTPLFILKFLTAVSDKLNQFKPAPVIINTWGDAIFAVMNNVADMAEYAFILQQTVQNTDWSLAGLPQLNIRIALHAGPVFLADDPLLKVVNAYGTHVNRAARMEPVTAPGSIYVSEQFAAALLLERRGDYRFEHAGIIELPKKFGKQEMFRLVKFLKADNG